MAGVGGFRGVSAAQDARFSNKSKAALKKMKFPPELDLPVDYDKVNWTVMKEWVAKRVTELLGIEEEVLISMIHNHLIDQHTPPKEMHVELTPFLEKNTSLFMKELWAMLNSASSNESGVPLQLLEAKQAELKERREREAAIQAQLALKRAQADQERAALEARLQAAAAASAAAATAAAAALAAGGAGDRPSRFDQPAGGFPPPPSDAAANGKPSRWDRAPAAPAAAAPDAGAAAVPASQGGDHAAGLRRGDRRERRSSRSRSRSRERARGGRRGSRSRSRSRSRDRRGARHVRPRSRSRERSREPRRGGGGGGYRRRSRSRSRDLGGGGRRRSRSPGRDRGGDGKKEKKAKKEKKEKKDKRSKHEGEVPKHEGEVPTDEAAGGDPAAAAAAQAAEAVQQPEAGGGGDTAMEDVPDAAADGAPAGAAEPAE